MKTGLSQDPLVEQDEELLSKAFDKDPVAALSKLIFDSGTVRYRGATGLELVAGKKWIAVLGTEGAAEKREARVKLCVEKCLLSPEDAEL